MACAIDAARYGEGMKHPFRSLLSVGTFLVAFVVNPLYFTGCGSSESAPNFGEAEMVALFDRTDDATYSFEWESESYELALSLDRAAAAAVARAESTSFMQSASACGDRTFYQSASACVTVTSLPVVGTFTLTRVDGATRTVVAENVAVTGEISVYGDELRAASLNVTFRDGADFIQLNSPTAGDFELERVHASGLGEEELDVDFQ